MPTTYSNYQNQDPTQQDNHCLTIQNSEYALSQVQVGLTPKMMPCYANPSARVTESPPNMQELKHVSSIPQPYTQIGSARLFFFDDTLKSILVEQDREKALKKTEELLGLLSDKILDRSYLNSFSIDNIVHIIIHLNKMNQKQLLPVGYEWNFMHLLIFDVVERIKISSNANTYKLIAKLIYNLGLFSNITLIPQDYSSLLDLFILSISKRININILDVQISRIIYGLGLLSKRGVHVEVNLPVLLNKFRLKHFAEHYTRRTQVIAQFYAGLYLLNKINSIDVNVYNYILTKKETILMSNKIQCKNVNELNELIAEYILSEGEISESSDVACRSSNCTEDNDEIDILIKNHINRETIHPDLDSIVKSLPAFSGILSNLSSEQHLGQNLDYKIPSVQYVSSSSLPNIIIDNTEKESKLLSMIIAHTPSYIPWTLLSDVLAKKIYVDQFSVSETEISFMINEEKIHISFIDLNRTNLDALANAERKITYHSNSYGTNQAQHVANDIASIIMRSDQNMWVKYDLLEKWCNSNPTGYRQCIDFALEYGNEHAVEQIRNASKRSYILSPISNQQNINKILQYGNPKEISLMLNSTKCYEFSDPITYRRAINEVLQNGNAMDISLLLNATKHNIDLRATADQRAIKEILENGNNVSIAMALSSSPDNAQVITKYACQEHATLNLRSLSPRDIYNKKFQDSLKKFIAAMNSRSATDMRLFSRQQKNIPSFFVPRENEKKERNNKKQRKAWTGS